MEEPLGIIYIIVNKVNGKVYIGQTRKSLSERMRHHFSKWETCTKLKKAIRTFGKENFIYNVLEMVPYSKLDEIEVRHIKNYNSIENGYNTKVGNTEFRGRTIHSLKSIEEDVIKDYNNNISIQNIAEKYNIAITSIYNILNRNNIKRNYNKGGFNSKAKIDFSKLVELKRAGYQTSYIAKLFGVAKSSVKRMVNRHKNIIFPRVSNTSASNVGGEDVL